MAADARYAMQLATALASLAAAHKPGVCKVTVLHEGIGPKLRARISAGLASHLDISWAGVDKDTLAGAHFPAFLSAATLFRLLMPTLLPSDVERTIYLDADTVVLDDLTELWRTDIGDNYVGAVSDANAPWAAGPGGPDWRALHLSPDSKYFNGGLLVVPLARWRAEGIADKALEVLRTGKPRWGDQDALNVVSEGRWYPLPCRWNVQTADIDGHAIGWAMWPERIEAALNDPAIVHYTDRTKPWSPGLTHPWGDRWFEFVDRTDWAGWRPRTEGHSLYRRAYWRLCRAGRVLVSGG